jgi:hypothetical protein
MARTRKPTNLHVLHGTLRKDRHADRAGEPHGAPLPAEAPRHIVDPDLRAIWAELAGTLPDGVATAGDSVAFECLMRLVGKMRLRPAGLPAPELSQLRHLLAAFGMTPADRSRVSASPEKGKFADFLEKYQS